MALNGSGVMLINSTGQPCVANTLISAAVFNAFAQDVATALSTALYKDGQQTVIANLPMATYRHTGVGAASSLTDYARADQLQNSALSYLTSVSGADTITASAPITPSAYAAGQTFRFVAAGTNTTAVTLNVSSLGAKDVTKNGTTALVAGDIPSGAVVEVVYDGTQFQLVNVALIIGTNVQAFDADTLKADAADVLTAGYAATPHDAGTKSTGTYTPDEANGNMQYCVNGGAFTLAPPTNNCTLVIQITNNASAGVITTSGFTKVSGSFTTTDGDDFFAFVTKCNGFSSLDIKALQ